MVQVIAHRGARSLAPENTLKAAQKGYETGADLWETDVNITRDGHLILFHDAQVLRCTNAASQFPLHPSYLIKDFDLAEIKSLDAGSYFIQEDPFSQIQEGRICRETLLSFQGETIPTLEQGLLFTKNNRWKINLELKSFPGSNCDTSVPEQTLSMIYHTGISLNRVVISSFNHYWLDWIVKKEPDLEIQALVGKNHTGPLDFKDLGFSTYNANVNLIDENQIRYLKEKGKKINLFTINDPETFHRFTSLGVDGIFTDFPQRFAQCGQ